MDKLTALGKWLYAAAFFVFGIQHFMYANFVATLIPGWLPWHLFWAVFVGIAFILAAVSIVINKYTRLSSLLLATLLALFILLIHIPNLSAKLQNAQSWARALQDLTIMGTALLISGQANLQLPGKYLFAIPLVFLAMQHFTHAAFVTAKVPAWFPAVEVWDYIIGLVIIVMVAGIISNRYLGAPALMLAVLLLAFALLYHVPLLAANLYNGQQWTAAMLDAAIAGGAFVVAGLPAIYYKNLNMATK
ncbi:DoxX family protein [Mucilaginibacter pedocola]|uniref:DoxX family protein n=1 Tax=Mucilaginibacter pedocola TaxID=1792845 RepID=A0A1S9PG97_9SPHI|nr:hypothetical protein [Mucilaginibacter pedocola]OOQ59969.1 hypothetical protein BC343_27855 [Mucilaginibacter pedocola]